MKTWKKLAALLLALSMAFALAACSNSQGGDGTAEPTGTPPVETQGAEDTQPPETEPADATDDPAGQTAEPAGDFTTVAQGKLTMSTNAAFPPYEMTTDSGDFEGIDVEIATAIAEKLGLELDILDTDFDSALLAVNQGKSDMVMAGVSITDDRLLVMDFSETYATGIQVVIVKEGSDVTLDNLGEKMIGVQKGTTGWSYCTDDYGEEHVTAYDNGLTAVQALVSGKVDCVVIDNAPAQEFVKANDGLTILDTEYANEDYSIGVDKGNTALLDAINGALKELIDSGKVQEIIDKYIPAN